MTMLRALGLSIALLVASCAHVDTASNTPNWRLISATEAADDRHLIVTIALDEPDALAEVARRLESDYPVDLVAEWPLAAIDVHCLVFRARGNTDLERLERRLDADDGVRTVERMRQFSVLGNQYSDEYLELQKSLVAINALKAHRFATGANIRIAVVDTGVDVTHPDLADQVEAAKDFVGDGSDRAGQETHGTAIAGVIAADATNGKGIVGVAPDARLMALRGCWQRNGAGQCSTFSLARAINFAILNEADVLNLSLAGPHDPLLAELIDAALQRGVVVVAAHGKTERENFPASLAGVISAAEYSAGQPWSATSSQPLPAPSVDVITTSPGGGYDFVSGSSVAAAHVAGVAALLLQREPNLTPQELHLALTRGVTNDASQQSRPMLDSCRAVSGLRSENIAGQC